MQFQITRTDTHWSKGERARKGRAFITTNALEPLEDWAKKTEIYSRSWKSRAWSMLGRRYNDLVGKVIEQELKAKARFSHKAGCSCGCSPGFILEDKNGTWGRTYFLNIQFTDEELQPLRDACTKADKMFEKELEKNSDD